MKFKILILCFYLLVLICCSPSKSELFKETDMFVESLQSTYESYGLLTGTNHTKKTSDGLYTITPVGRLINVKIEKVVEKAEYEELQKDLKDHYVCNLRVKNVYICKGGTIMIDCRN